MNTGKRRHLTYEEKKAIDIMVAPDKNIPNEKVAAVLGLKTAAVYRFRQTQGTLPVAPVTMKDDVAALVRWADRMQPDWRDQ